MKQYRMIQQIEKLNVKHGALLERYLDINNLKMEKSLYNQLNTLEAKAQHLLSKLNRITT